MYVSELVEFGAYVIWCQSTGMPPEEGKIGMVCAEMSEYIQDTFTNIKVHFNAVRDTTRFNSAKK